MKIRKERKKKSIYKIVFIFSQSILFDIFFFVPFYCFVPFSFISFPFERKDKRLKKKISSSSVFAFETKQNKKRTKIKQLKRKRKDFESFSVFQAINNLRTL